MLTLIQGGVVLRGDSQWGHPQIKLLVECNCTRGMKQNLLVIYWFHAKNCIFYYMTDKIFPSNQLPSETLATPTEVKC